MRPLLSPRPTGIRLTPVCLVKAFLQQLSLLWCFLNGATLAGGKGEEEEEEKRNEGRPLGPCFLVST